ncbi:hypothetical protein EIP86_010836 [Pleurotus ostreatoroseus]|nr:hypothetical protein EIP86_010836 [Pleurotus ostreatoroseus]
MALSFIGKPISLISHSDVRYRGILAGIDPQASTIQLSNVYSMGTESRRPPDQFIPPVQEPYAYIIFRASEVKDLAVDEPQPRRSVHDDPAVLGASAPIVPQGAYPYPAGGGPYQQPGGQPQQPQTTPSPQNAQEFAQAPAQGTPPIQSAVPQNGVPAPAATKTGRSSAVNSATASLESVERALGDLRVNGGETSNNTRGGHGGGRRGGRHHEAKQGDLRVPTTDFDFESANARFDKSALSPNKPAKSGETTPQVAAEEDGEEKKKAKDKEAAPSAYNPKQSFFDSLSSGSNGPSSEGRGRGGGRRGGGGRNRREEERERNVATFGEPGGIGLMGPGAYVGGWGGYGRRGGRGRRSGGAATNSRQ